MSACPRAALEAGSRSPAVPQIFSDWQVAALSDPQAVHELSEQLKAEGVDERRLVAVGLSAFLLFWR